MKFRVLLAAVLLNGCTLIELPVEVEPADSRLAVSSVMVGRTGMLVTVTRSFSALSGREVNQFSDGFVDSMLVRRGRLVLRYGTVTDTLRSATAVPGFFAALTPGILNGDSLHLAVYDSVSGLAAAASTRLMPPVAPDSAGFIMTRRGRFIFSGIAVSHPDPEGDNWYALHVYSARRMRTAADPMALLTGAEALVFSRQFSDRGAKNGRLRQELYFDNFDNRDEQDTLLIALSNIDEAYFRFLDARRRSGGLVSSFLAEPLNYPDNVEGGYGFFSAHQPKALLYFPPVNGQPSRFEPVDLFLDALPWEDLLGFSRAPD